MLFVHGTRWTSTTPVAAEVTTLLHQDPSRRHARLTFDPDNRSADEIGASIAEAPGMTEDFEHDSADWRHLAHAAGRPAPGRRERVWAGGPVPSHRFEL